MLPFPFTPDERDRLAALEADANCDIAAGDPALHQHLDAIGWQTENGPATNTLAIALRDFFIKQSKRVVVIECNPVHR